MNGLIVSATRVHTVITVVSSQLRHHSCVITVPCTQVLSCPTSISLCPIPSKILTVFPSCLVISLSLPSQASQGAYAGSSEGPVARAVHKCRDAVKASPSNHTAQYHLGRLLLLTGQPSQALVHLRAALGIKPTHMETRCVCVWWWVGDMKLHKMVISFYAL